MWNPMSNTKMENKLITREIIIVINRFGLLKPYVHFDSADFN